jgi:hypothetical protein
MAVGVALTIVAGRLLEPSSQPEGEAVAKDRRAQYSEIEVTATYTMGDWHQPCDRITKFERFRVSHCVRYVRSWLFPDLNGRAKRFRCYPKSGPFAASCPLCEVIRTQLMPRLRSISDCGLYWL